VQQTKQRQQKLQLSPALFWSPIVEESGAWGMEYLLEKNLLLSISSCQFRVFCPSHSPVSASLLALPLPLPAQLS